MGTRDGGANALPHPVVERNGSGSGVHTARPTYWYLVISNEKKSKSYTIEQVRQGLKRGGVSEAKTITEDQPGSLRSRA
jgi:hypothetical protein